MSLGMKEMGNTYILWKVLLGCVGNFCGVFVEELMWTKFGESHWFLPNSRGHLELFVFLDGSLRAW